MFCLCRSPVFDNGACVTTLTVPCSYQQDPYPGGWTHHSLRNIHRLTTSGNFTLRIDFEDFEPCTVCRFWPLSIIYYEFYIGGEDEDYRLHLGFH
ncbi:hypothetical protein BaRGS_00029651 [Batillaria attramentaria]|uniref:Fibrinogen C-terminal domain-containing protein n=1 Tax=Batillaria attramentaria TaxID=370345 RepID=A0ABD0JW18_9CAEN